MPHLPPDRRDRPERRRPAAERPVRWPQEGHLPGYSYSAAYQALKETEWTVENFTTYIKDPRGVTPGTKMVYAGLKDETQIKNLIAYLQQFGPDGKRK